MDLNYPCTSKIIIRMNKKKKQQNKNSFGIFLRTKEIHCTHKGIETLKIKGLQTILHADTYQRNGSMV